MRYGSVCSGIESASVAWHGLGWQPAWFAEIEPFPSAVLAHRFPEVANLGDMTKIARGVLTGEIEAPDVLVGGTPCQAFSVAGMREGLADERGQLTIKYVELADAIDLIRVRRGEESSIVVYENVPGLLSSKDNAFGCLLGALAGEDDALVPAGEKWSNAGYVLGSARAIAWRVLDAQYFGVAQRRRRVFLVASARNDFDPRKVLFESEGVRRDSAPSRGAGQNAAAAAGQGVESSWPADLAPTLNAAFGSKLGLENQHVNQGCPLFVPAAQSVAGSIAHTLKAEGHDGNEDGTGRGTPIVAGHGTQDPDVRIDMAHTLGRNQGQENAILAFDTTQVTSPHNRSNPQAFDPCHTLQAGAHAPAIIYPLLEVGKRTGASTTDQRAGLGVGNEADTMFTLQASAQHGVAYGIPGNWIGRAPENGGNATEPMLDVSPCQTRTDRHGVAHGLAVRRLTPTECERLQGFPDGWTDVPYRNKPAADGPRYKALGNSMAVPCMAWIGQRIKEKTC